MDRRARERKENRGARDTQAEKNEGEGKLEEGEISIGLEMLQLYGI